jgi:hypothetical protein
VTLLPHTAGQLLSCSALQPATQQPSSWVQVVITG